MKAMQGLTCCRESSESCKQNAAGLTSFFKKTMQEGISAATILPSWPTAHDPEQRLAADLLCYVYIVWSCASVFWPQNQQMTTTNAQMQSLELNKIIVRSEVENPNSQNTDVNSTRSKLSLGSVSPRQPCAAHRKSTEKTCSTMSPAPANRKQVHTYMYKYVDALILLDKVLKYI